MAQRPKAKPKLKGQKNTDKEQSARFIETAQTLETDNKPDRFERALNKIMPPRKTPKA